MSSIAGILKNSEVTEKEIRDLLAPTEHYGIAASTIYVRNRVGMGFQPFPTNDRSALDDCPIADSYRNAITFDGRLDNHGELAQILQLGQDISIADSKIVLAAFRRWGEKCFSRFSGDWAVALWCERGRTLYLARDHAGTRPLYFSERNGCVFWSTHLDGLLHSLPGLNLSEEYAARYLSESAIADLTPYQEIRSVRPAHYHAIREDGHFISAHWSPSGADTLHYKTDVEYEQHFLHFFFQSVERRTGKGAPVLAELSGGMDSTSIVCASDFLRRRSEPQAALLNTISYCDDNESSLDERRYFSITEAKRGKVGTHLDMAFSDRTFAPHDGSEGLYALPGADNLSIVRERRFEEAVSQRGFRSILSGIGGDELLGGVPDPYPELSNYLAHGQVRRLFTRGVAWSLVDRTPLLETLARTLRFTAQIYKKARPSHPPDWLGPKLKDLATPGVYGCTTISRLKHSPRQLENERTWWAVMETLPHLFPRLLSRPEYRYPFLDKDLVNFLHRLPYDQLLRPGRRRFLMRRALVGIVPEEILERKRKAFQLSGPMRAFQQHQNDLKSLFARSITAQYRFICPEQFKRALNRLCRGDATGWQALLRAIAFELWLQSTENSSKHAP